VGFTVEDRHVRHISCRSFLVIVLTESKDMPISRAIVCLWFIFLAECETLNFVDVGRRTWTVWMTIIARCRLKELMLPVMPIILLKFSLHQLQHTTVHRPETSYTRADP